MKKIVAFVFVCCVTVTGFEFNCYGYTKIAAPIHPITVYADTAAIAHEILLFCDNYVTYLQKVWYIRPLQMSCVVIDIRSRVKDPKFHWSPGSAYIASNYQNTRCRYFLARSLCSSLLFDSIESSPDKTLPLFISTGLAGIFLQQKLNPEYADMHNRMIDNEFIPFDVFVTLTAPLSGELGRLFRFQSIYFMEYLHPFIARQRLVTKFLTEYQSNPENALGILMRASGKKTVGEFETHFIENASKKNVIYNTVSSQMQFGMTDTIRILENILTFNYTTGSRSVKKKISVNAFDLKIEDIPYIPQNEIEEKVLQLRLLKDSSLCKQKIEHYIQALRSLQSGDFETYYDQLYMGQKYQ